MNNFKKNNVRRECLYIYSLWTKMKGLLFAICFLSMVVSGCSYGSNKCKGDEDCEICIDCSRCEYCNEDEGVCGVCE